MQKECPICGHTFTAMNHHLTRRHRVENKEELALLLALASGRFKGRLSCPVCDKTRLARLDRHLSKTHKVEGMDREQMLTEAKRECIIRGLAELRSRAPTPPLVSELDVGQTARAEQRRASVLISFHVPTAW